MRGYKLIVLFFVFIAWDAFSATTLEVVTNAARGAIQGYPFTNNSPFNVLGGGFTGTGNFTLIQSAGSSNVWVNSNAFFAVGAGTWAGKYVKTNTGAQDFFVNTTNFVQWATNTGTNFLIKNGTVAAGQVTNTVLISEIGWRRRSDGANTNLQTFYETVVRAQTVLGNELHLGDETHQGGSVTFNAGFTSPSNITASNFIGNSTQLRGVILGDTIKGRTQVLPTNFYYLNISVSKTGGDTTFTTTNVNGFAGIQMFDQFVLGADQYNVTKAVNNTNIQVFEFNNTSYTNATNMILYPAPILMRDINGTNGAGIGSDGSYSIYASASNPDGGAGGAYGLFFLNGSNGILQTLDNQHAGGRKSFLTFKDGHGHVVLGVSLYAPDESLFVNDAGLVSVPVGLTNEHGTDLNLGASRRVYSHQSMTNDGVYEGSTAPTLPYHMVNLGYLNTWTNSTPLVSASVTLNSSFTNRTGGRGKLLLVGSVTGATGSGLLYATNLNRAKGYALANSIIGTVTDELVVPMNTNDVVIITNMSGVGASATLDVNSSEFMQDN